MNKKNIFIAFFAVVFFTIPMNAQNNEVTISVDTLSNNLYMLTGRGGNIGIYVGEKNVFMIDDQFAPLSDKIMATIKSLSDKPISFLFNTHMHGDHSGGNAKFNTDATSIIAHSKARVRIKENMKRNLDAQKITKEYYNLMLPEITFNDDLTIHDGEETIMAIHVHNAHTDGDALIYFSDNNIIHMGDTYFGGRYPFIDLRSGGSVDGLIEAIQKALMVINDDTKVIPGHGRPSNKKEMTSYLDMLQDVKKKVLKAIESGKSLEEVKADNSLTKAYDATHGTGFIKPEVMRETFYKSLYKED